MIKHLIKLLWFITSCPVVLQDPGEGARDETQDGVKQRQVGVWIQEVLRGKWLEGGGREGGSVWEVGGGMNMKEGWRRRGGIWRGCSPSNFIC